MRRQWELLARLVQWTFRDGTPPEELIPEGKGEFRGIGLVEVARKVCAAVVNCRMKVGFVLHDTLHGFIEGRGMGTATLETKLSQHLAGLTQKPLFQVFLDIHKK